MVDTKLAYCCTECGGQNIQAKAWVNLNTEEIDYSLSESGDSDDYWCKDCEEHNKPILKNIRQ